MELENSGKETRAFLEAHFYSDGIRYIAFPPSQTRPVWAPPADRTGINNGDLTMKPGAAVIEYSRFSTKDVEADWLGVFWASEDKDHGDRRVYAGVGLWSQGYWYSNGDELVRVLAEISGVVAKDRGVPERLTSNILTFTNKHLPEHLEDEAMLSEGILPIKAAVEKQRPKTKVEALNFPLGNKAVLPPEVCKAVADRVRIANLTRDSKEDYSRLLIVITDDHAKITERAISPLTEVPDLTAHVLKAIGIVGAKSRQRTEQLEQENAEFSQQIESLKAQNLEMKKNEKSLMSQLSDLQEVNRNLESEHALPPDLVRRLEQIESRLTSLNEPVLKRINSLEGRIPRFPNSEIRQSRRQLEPTFLKSLGTGILMAAIVFTLVAFAYIVYSYFF